MRVFYIENFIFYVGLIFTLSLNVVVDAFDFEKKPPIRGSCSANFTEPEGTFSSMNFPDNPYPALANCSWKIEVCLKFQDPYSMVHRNVYPVVFLGQSRKTDSNKYSVYELERYFGLFQ